MAHPPLAQRTVCMSELSKDVKGELRPAEEILQKCSDRDCVTLATVHELVLDASGFRCDSKLGSLLDGQITTKIISKFIDGDGERRGVHEGEFRWTGKGGLVTGTLQGVTNLGTHREPVFGDCQHCDDRGVMEGQLIGTITKAMNRSLRRCEVRAAYRLRFDHTKGGGDGLVVGVLEGAILCEC